MHRLNFLVVRRQGHLQVIVHLALLVQYLYLHLVVLLAAQVEVLAVIRVVLGVLAVLLQVEVQVHCR
jgi:hypothetical protein